MRNLELFDMYMGMGNEEIMEVYQDTDDPELKRTLTDVILEKNEKLFFKILRNFSDAINPSDYEDYMQTARKVVIEKLPQYTKEKAREIRLTTFLRRYILMGFSDASATGSGITKHEHNMLVKINKVRKELEASKKDYTEIDICEKLGIGIDAYNSIISNEKKLHGGVRLDDPDNATFVMPAADAPEDIVIRNELKDSIGSAIQHIIKYGGSDGKKIATVIKLSFGLGDERIWSSSEIAKLLDVTSGAVRRMRRKGLDLLKNSPELSNYRYSSAVITGVEEERENTKITFVCLKSSMDNMLEAAEADRDGEEAILSTEYTGETAANNDCEGEVMFG